MEFGVNDSDVTSRRGDSSSAFTFPRILGIEAVGVIDAVGDGVDLEAVQKVAMMMGGLGRQVVGEQVGGEAKVGRAVRWWTSRRKLGRPSPVVPARRTRRSRYCSRFHRSASN